jgi:hypothetical protein
MRLEYFQRRQMSSKETSIGNRSKGERRMNTAESSAIPASSPAINIEAIAQSAAQKGVENGVAAERKRTVAILMALFQQTQSEDILTAINLITGQVLTAEKLYNQIAAQ